MQAIAIQRSRFSHNNTAPPGSGVMCRRNARMGPALIDRFCPQTKTAEKALSRAMEKLELSGRAYHSILKMARTIADLGAEEKISADHILEAIQHRRLGDDPYDVLAK
jgi:magnesium chelatase family protein